MATSSLGRCCSLVHSRICSRVYISRRQKSWWANTTFSSLNCRKPQTHSSIKARWCSQETFNEPASGYYYAKSHEWASTGSELTTIGISNYAQEKLGDVVFVELPSAGDSISKGDQLGVLESVKAAADIYSPVGGCVVEVNAALEDTPEIINKDPYNQGWLLKLKEVDPGDLEGLMSSEDYKTYLKEGAV